MMHIYIHETLVPKMLEGISNGTTKAKLLEKYGLTTLHQETVGEWPIKLGFKYDFSVNNYHVGGHEKKDMICYIWKFIDYYLQLEWCMFRLIYMTADESDQYKWYRSKSLFQDQADITGDTTPMTTPMMLLIW